MNYNQAIDIKIKHRKLIKTRFEKIKSNLRIQQQSGIIFTNTLLQEHIKMCHGREAAHSPLVFILCISV